MDLPIYWGHCCHRVKFHACKRGLCAVYLILCLYSAFLQWWNPSRWSWNFQHLGIDQTQPCLASVRPCNHMPTVYYCNAGLLQYKKLGLCSLNSQHWIGKTETQLCQAENGRGGQGRGGVGQGWSSLEHKTTREESQTKSYAGGGGLLWKPESMIIWSHCLQFLLLARGGRWCTGFRTLV